MRRIIIFSMMFAVIGLSVTGLTGCGGSESGTQQITEKLPSETEGVAVKGAKKAAPSKN